MSNPTTAKVTPFLMFTGQAEEAMSFYVDLFADAKVLSVNKYGAEGPGPEGTIMHGIFSLNGQEIMCTDAPQPPDFTFTPSLSLFVTCTSEEELDGYFAALSGDGEVRMPPDNYGFSRKFAWTDDRFGVSWQLNLP